MGYSNDYDKNDYLIKKGGTLDQIGYTRTLRDYPIQYNYQDGFVDFQMYSDLDQELKKLLNMPKNFSVKVPEKAIHRTGDSKSDVIYDGTFYDISNTHQFDVGLFIDMMEQNIGVAGVYIYQYLKHKNDIYTEGYNIGRYQLELELKVPWRTVHDYIRKLKDGGYIQVIGDVGKGEKTAANTYKICDKNQDWVKLEN